MGAWKQLAALPNARSGATAVFHGGKVYLFGGSSDPVNDVYTSTLYIYDPGANTWSSGAALPATGRCHAFSTAADGIHLIFLATGAHYAYDPTANTWAARTTAPGVGRLSAFHFTDASGRFYLAGGQSTGAAEVVQSHRYDPTTDAWSARADVPAGVARTATIAPGVLGTDGKIYLARGNVAVLAVYNPTTDTWSSSPTMPDTSPFDVTASQLPTGTVITLPHIRITSGGTPELLRRIDGYNAGAGTWAMGVIPDYPGRVHGATVATEPGGVVYLLGGIYWNAETVPFTISDVWSYKQNDPPTAPTPKTLLGGVTVSTAVKNRASWTFNDPNAGDSQSKFNFYYRPTGTTTWATVTSTIPNPWYEFPAGSLDPVEYEWQVEVYDAAGEISPRTTSAIFTADDPPDGPTITYPVNGQTVEQNETVVWSAPVQDAYRIRRVADAAGVAVPGTEYSNTGEVTDSLNRSAPVVFDVKNRFEHVLLEVKDGGLWSPVADVLVEVTYTPPPAPTYTAYPDASTGSLLLMIATPEPVDEDQPPAAYVDVYIDDGDGEELKATGLATTTSWRYWTPVSGRDYGPFIRVESVAANGTTASST